MLQVVTRPAHADPAAHPARRELEPGQGVDDAEVRRPEGAQVAGNHLGVTMQQQDANVVAQPSNAGGSHPSANDNHDRPGGARWPERIRERHAVGLLERV